jgi:hypothetical protein
MLRSVDIASASISPMTRFWSRWTPDDALHRNELAELDVETIQQRQGR